jgi:hypothetical protein
MGMCTQPFPMSNVPKPPKSNGSRRLHPAPGRVPFDRPSRHLGLPEGTGRPQLDHPHPSQSVDAAQAAGGEKRGGLSATQDPAVETVHPAGGDTRQIALAPVVGRSSGGLGESLPSVPTQAPDVPIDAVGGANVRAILRRAAPHAAPVLFEAINRLNRLSRHTEAEQLYEESIIAANFTGRLAIKTIEMTIGKSLNVHATVQNQTGVPKWESLPPDVKEKFLEALSKSPSRVIDATSEEVDDAEPEL